MIRASQVSPPGVGSATGQSNPFCTRFVRPGAIEYRFGSSTGADGDIDAICRRLLRGRVGSIVGPHGSGKSTLIETLLPHLSGGVDQVCSLRLQHSSQPPLGHALACWSAVRSKWKRCQSNSLVVIDGAEQLPALYRLRLARVARRGGPRLLLTSHHRLASIPVLHQTKVDRQLAIELTARLIQDAAPEVSRLVRQQLANQDWTTEVNLRDFWFDCYDTVQSQRMTSNLT